MSPAQIKKRYATRIVAILNKIRDLLVEQGWQCDDVTDNECDYYEWGFACDTGVEAEYDGGKISIDFKIAESEYWDGEKGGVNFMLDIVAFGGRILGGLTPFNYTPEVWVKRRDAEAIETRFKLMEDASIDEVPQLIHSYLADLKKEKHKPVANGK